MIANGKLRQTYDYHNKPRGNRFPIVQSLTILSQLDCNGKKRKRAPIQDEIIFVYHLIKRVLQKHDITRTIL